MSTDPHGGSAAPRSDDPRPEPPDYSAVPFTGNYSDVGAEEELRRDYERELAEWEARQATAATLRDAAREALAAYRTALDGDAEKATPEVAARDSVANKDRLDSLYVTMPNYVRIVYGYVPAWAKEAMRRG